MISTGPTIIGGNVHIGPYKPYCIYVSAQRAKKSTKVSPPIIQNITEKFPYYAKMKNPERTWQNSIRHNLSLSQDFVKVGTKGQHGGGKGHLWTIRPDVEEERLARLFGEEEEKGAAVAFQCRVIYSEQ